MTRPTVLIAAFSGRSLAASAQRAGYNPLVADAFGDEDTASYAQATQTLPSSLRAGFRKKSLIRALTILAQNASSPPIGIVLGPGFEEHPELIDDLAEKFKILGNSAQTVAKSKDPSHIFPLLRERGIPHPQTAFSPPDNPNGWLKKRIGGSGGMHITPCPPDLPNNQSQNCYFQRIELGMPVSVAGVVSPKGFAIGLCQQWLTPSPSRPYRFGGILSPTTLDPDTETRMVDVVVELTHNLGLIGFNSFDFLITDKDVLFLEVNPRPTAALDVLDGPDGHMFKAHLVACDGQDPTDIVSPQTDGPQPERRLGTHALAYLYADQGPLEIPTINWPAWASDRPTPGTRIKHHQPLATVTASANNASEVEKICRNRLGELEILLYGPAR